MLLSRLSDIHKMAWAWSVSHHVDNIMRLGHILKHTVRLIVYAFWGRREIPTAVWIARPSFPCRSNSRKTICLQNLNLKCHILHSHLYIFTGGWELLLFIHSLKIELCFLKQGRWNCYVSVKDCAYLLPISGCLWEREHNCLSGLVTSG